MPEWDEEAATAAVLPSFPHRQNIMLMREDVYVWYDDAEIFFQELFN